MSFLVKWIDYVIKQANLVHTESGPPLVMVVEPDGVIYAHVVEELAKRVPSVIEIQ